MEMRCILFFIYHVPDSLSIKWDPVWLFLQKQSGQIDRLLAHIHGREEGKSDNHLTSRILGNYALCSKDVFFLEKTNLL